MENHYIIGDSTLLAKGLNLVLKDLGCHIINQISLNQADSLSYQLLNTINYVWIDGSEEIKNVLKICQEYFHKYPANITSIFCNSKDPILIKSFLKAGIYGYFPTQCNTNSIKDALFQLSNGNKYIDPKLSQILTQNLLGMGQKPPINDTITKREKQILQLIIEEYTTQEIADKLFISFCTVETHRLHLIQKMGVRNTAGLVREALYTNLYQKSMNSMIN